MAISRSPRRPIRGLRLTYEINLPSVSNDINDDELDVLGGVVGTLAAGLQHTKMRVRMKESIGNFLGLRPKPPATIEIENGPQSGRSRLMAPAGFRFESYKFLVVPGTTIVEPNANCAQNSSSSRPICTFSIGFGRGPREKRVNRWRIQQWIMTTRAKDKIMGFVTPSGVKHVWKGQLDSARTGGGLIPGALDLGDVAGIVGGLAEQLPNLPGL